MSELDDIKARAEAATEGPWRAIGTGAAGGDHWYICDDGESLASIHANDGDGSEDQRHDDAVFMAHARTDIPKLVAALEAVLGFCQNADEYADEVDAEGIRDIIIKALA